MSKIYNNLDVVANVLIIVIAVMLIGVIVQRYLFSSSVPTFDVKPTIGKTVNFPIENFNGQTKTVFLVLATTCHFCSESASFYKRLAEIAKSENVKVVAWFPQNIEESTQYLSKLGLAETTLEVKQSPLSTFDTNGTPTLIITNNKGEVTDFWIGKLTADEETKVIKLINPR